VIIIITLFIFVPIIIATLIGLTLAFLRAIDKNKDKIIKQTQLIYEQQSYLKNLKYKEVLDNINCKI